MNTKRTSTHPNTDPRYWNERYQDDFFAYGQEPNAYLKSHWHHAPKGRALCLADGEGRNGVFLAQMGFEVTCLDFSLEAQKKALALAQSKGVRIHYEIQDLNQYDLQPSSWDLIASIFFQPAVNTRQRLYSQLQQALKPGGVFVLECKCEENSDANNRYPGVAQLSKEIEPLKVIHALEAQHHLNEGVYHQGEQRTTQICAVRS
jgi:SAM-dependent methyltransferase